MIVRDSGGTRGWGARLAIAVAFGLLAFWIACTAPSDSSTYQYAADGLSLGLACDPEHPCGAGKVCRIPAYCTREEDVVTPDGGAIPQGQEGAGSLGDGCNATQACASPYHCEEISDTAICTADCASGDDCPEGGVCWLERGPAQSWCVHPGGLVGDACSLENDCTPGLFCENRASGGYCTMLCGRYAPCPGGMDSVCTKLSGDFGNYCLKRCTAEGEGCRDDVGCRKMTRADVWVCFPGF